MKTFILLCGLWLLVPVVRVCAEPAEPANYRSLIEEALAEYEANNWAEARALFAKAHALLPNARALRGLGMAEFEPRNYSDSAAISGCVSRSSRSVGTMAFGTRASCPMART